jgi:hypothetical protein
MSNYSRVIYGVDPSGKIVPIKVDASGNIGSGGGATSNVAVTNYPATQAVAAAALPLPTGAATESTMAAVLSQLQGDRNLASQSFVDSVGIVYVRILAFNTTTNGFEPVALKFDATTYTPVLPETALQSTDIDTIETSWRATTNGAGYADGDTLSQFTFLKTAPTPSIVGVLWANNGTAIAAPPIGHRNRIGALSATEATLSSRLSEGSPVTGETIPSGSGAFGWLSSLRAMVQAARDRLPASLGAGTSAQSLKVVLPSDQSSIPARLGVTDYVQSAGNNTSAQLAAAATFTGAIESALNYPQILVSVRCDQPYTVTVKQYSDAAATIAFAPDIVYTRGTGVSLNQAINVVASYFQVLVQNTGTIATTALFAETWLGILPPLPNLTNSGDLPVSLPKKATVLSPTAPATAVLNLLDPLGTDLPTDVSLYNSAILYVISGNTGRNFQLNGGWSVGTVGQANIPIFDMGQPAASPLLGPQPTSASFNRAYYVNLSGVNFVQLTLSAGAAVTSARIVMSQASFSLPNFTAPQQLTAPSTAIADIPSSTINTVGTTLSTVITPTWGVSQLFTYTVTAVTGTPTLTANFLESLDGVNYSTIATLTMTAAGTFSTNLTAIQGRFYRYQEIFAGAASSLTRSVSRTQSNEQAPIAGRPTLFTTLNTSGTANTSTLALAANPARKYLFVQNLSASPMFITTGATAANNAGIRLAANGGSQEFAANGLCPTNAIQIICPAAATQPYTVVEA